MHQDSHGQYGPNTDDTPILDTFLEHYNDKTSQYNLANANDANDANDANEYSIECPFCRTINTSNEIMEIKGSNSNCIVCDDANIEIYLSKCKHSHICSECCNKLVKL
jgi:hypothetical protein